MRRSISTCMRNAVAGFSIMWVYKRTRTRSMHFVNGTRRPVTHILQVENTRSGPARGPLLRRAACSMKKRKKNPGSSIYFTDSDDGEDSCASPGFPPGISFLRAFPARVTYGPVLGKRANSFEGSASCVRQTPAIVSREEITFFFIIARLLFALTTSDF